METKTIVCISCYFKGFDFMDELHLLGNKVILITSEHLKDRAWPWHAITESFYMKEESYSVWNLDHLVQGFSHLMRSTKVDAVVALDDYDVEKAALIRENFRIPGMGQTTHRYFRDKLAMRQRALHNNIRVPEFTAIFNDDEINGFVAKVAGPWILKPRSEASATGIKKISDRDHLWETVNSLGEERYLFLLESFKPGDVYHVDSLTYQGKVLFTSASKYLSPPMQVAHDGGVFRSQTLNHTTKDFKELEALNKKLLTGFGIMNGATHSEFIRGKADGRWYFLETSSRVGGAHIPDLVEASTGINIWREWARMEDHLLKNIPYQIQKPTAFAAGLLVALTNKRNPEYAEFMCDAVYKFLPIENHIGIVYRSNDDQLVRKCLDETAEKVTSQYLSVIPPKDKPTS